MATDRDSDNSAVDITAIFGRLPANIDSTQAARPLKVEKLSDEQAAKNILQEYLESNAYGYIGGLDSRNGRASLLRKLSAAGIPNQVVRIELRNFGLEELRLARKETNEALRKIKLEAMKALLSEVNIFAQQDREVHSEILAIMALSSDARTAQSARREFLLFTGKRLT